MRRKGELLKVLKHFIIKVISYRNVIFRFI